MAKTCSGAGSIGLRLAVGLLQRSGCSRDITIVRLCRAWRHLLLQISNLGN